MLICKIHQRFRLSVCNSGRVQQPVESAFLADSALLSNVPANHTHEYHHRCLYSHVSKYVVQPSDICVQILASPHCSHHCSRCSSACRKISVAQLVETQTTMQLSATSAETITSITSTPWLQFLFTQATENKPIKLCITSL